ncbi:MAG TPA: FecR domain-containing protein, partial [Acidobacteriota bacterium]|nr:FecR domain-containing protein [Acidobacteriota bacterium]
GEPDPEIQELEKLLGALRHGRAAPDFPEIPVVERRPRWFEHPWTRIHFRPAYVALALIAFAVMIPISMQVLRGRGGYEVVSLNGTPKVGGAQISQTGRLQVGEWLETDAASRARIQVGEIGEVEVEPKTRIGLVRARATEHRLSLQRGIIHAFILAPARRFFVDTPSAQAIDLGCSYTLEVDDDGTGFLRVTSGWVAFEFHGREAFVPAGAMCLTRPGTGPGTPFREDASAAFRAALEKLDFDATSPEARSALLGDVLLGAREQDALTLWHLLARSNEAERVRVYERLATLVPPPKGTTREGLLGRDHKMLDLWWDEFGLGDTEWWRLWERPWPASK